MQTAAISETIFGQMPQFFKPLGKLFKTTGKVFPLLKNYDQDNAACLKLLSRHTNYSIVFLDV